MNDTIFKAIKRGPKKGLTAATIADRTGLNLNSVRTTLALLKANGLITIAGTAKQEKGRPANLYTVA